MVVKGLKVAVMGRRGRVAAVGVGRARGLVRLSLELVQVPMAGMAPGCILHASTEHVNSVVDVKCLHLLLWHASQHMMRRVHHNMVLAFGHAWLTAMTGLVSTNSIWLLISTWA